MTSHHHAMTGLSPEPLSASGRSSEKMSLPSLQSKMKCDPEGYETELLLVYNQFKSSLELFKQQADLGFKSVTGSGGSDPTVAKDLADRAMFLAHVTPFYPAHLAQFPGQLSEFLHASARTLPSGLRLHVAQALILLMNRKMVDIGENLALFMELQTYGDKALKNLAYTHVVHSIKRMNMKHKNEVKNRTLQNVLFRMLQQEDETKAKRALITLRELHRRKVWFDENTANAICSACFHPSSRIMIACLSFLLDYEKIEDEDDSEASSSDEDTPLKSHVAINREDIYKAHHKGTLASKKKKKAKLQRAIRSMKKQQRLTSEKSTSNYHTPLNHLRDPQEFAEKLFSRLQACKHVERFEVKMMMLKVVARTIGLHRLVILNFYPYFINYITPHQDGVTELLAAAVQACHDMVPPDAVEPLFKQIVNKFIDDRAQPEAIAVGLNATREICLRMPLLMTEDLLQDLALYKKSHTKAVSVAARSLIGLFRELNPSLLIKKDRGRQHVDSKARPKAYGEVNVLSNVPGLELLEHDDDNEDSDDDDDEPSLRGTDGLFRELNPSLLIKKDRGRQHVDSKARPKAYGEVNVLSNVPGLELLEHDDDNEDSDDDDDEPSLRGTDDNLHNDELVATSDDEGLQITNSDSGSEDDTMISEDGDDCIDDNDSDVSGDEDEVDAEDEDEDENREAEDEFENNDAKDGGSGIIKKRKFADFDRQLNDAEASLRTLKRLAKENMGPVPLDSTDGFLSNEDFRRIKELKAKQRLAQQGLLKKADAKSTAFKIPTSDELSIKRVDPAKLEVHVKRRMTKEEKLALVKAGREERGKYMARAAVKQKKTGGLSNKQKEHKKAMPLVAKRAKVAKSRVEKRKKQQLSGKNFRGKKAWK